MKEDGVLAVHVSNKYLDLPPVVRLAALSFGKEAVIVDTEDEPEKALYGSTWILMADRRGFRARPALKRSGKPLTERKNVHLWTDEYSNLFRILK
ncbi:MAG: integral membrane protein-like protein [Actinobacteria bacterium]|nr:integral membrane protein-like protein [Actinomycetota bacterium]